jgi:alanine racemase
MQPESKTWVEVSKKALTNNVKAFRRHLGAKVGVMAVVKSNAYGHGLVETAQITDAAGAAWFGVDNVDEGIALRKAGIKKPILILGYTLKSRLTDAVKNDLSFILSNQETVRALKKLKLTGKKNSVAKVHLKIETGTTRQGVEGEDLLQIVREIKKTTGVRVEGASTHYANIEDTTESSFAESQLRRFQEGVALLHREGIDPMVLHTACSAAAILFPSTYFNLARVGISMYGLWPSKETQAIAQRMLVGTRHAVSLRLTPALSWKTRIAQIKSVKKGTPVSYGLTERVAHDSKIAVLPIGYWDGFDRGLSSIGQVLVRGQRCKVVGRVCMNMCMIDVTDVVGVNLEDEVVLIGAQQREEISAQDIAGKIGTIHYEVVTRINPTLPRLVKP